MLCAGVLLAGCGAGDLSEAVPGPTTSTAMLPETVSPTPTSTSMPVASSTPVATPTALPDPRLTEGGVYLYPDPLYRGDHLSIDVIPQIPPVEQDAPLTLTVQLPNGERLQQPVLRQDFTREPRARFRWVWDTTPFRGTQVLTFTLTLSPDVSDAEPQNNVLTYPFTLRPVEALPPPEPGVEWQSYTTPGFRIYYLSGTAAARDLQEIVPLADAAREDVAARLGASSGDPLDVYLLSRVAGQGGYSTSQWVALSYVDRFYAPARFSMTLRHELVHRLDAALGCDRAPAFVREGLAVLVAGGHYRPESLPRKAGLLRPAGRYIPLASLATDFYASQHEIGYLEAGAFLRYIVALQGWEGLALFCEVTSAAEGTPVSRLDAGLEALELGTLDTFESRWLRWLAAVRPRGEALSRERQALETELRLLEAMRAYQAAYDTVAHFRKGIFFNPVAGVQREITADFVRRPRDVQAIALELTLLAVQDALDVGDVGRASAWLDDVEASLVAGELLGTTQHAADIVAATLERQYEPYRLRCENFETACLVDALDPRAWPQRVQLWATRDADGAWGVTGPQPQTGD